MIDSNLMKIGLFRSVPFRYLTTGEGSTKNPQIIKYANSVFSDVAENTEGPRTFRVQAIFTGPAAETEATLFLRVARQIGTGVLLHPDVGMVTAMCTVHDVSRDGTLEGYITVDCEYLLLTQSPALTIAYAAMVDAKAAAVTVAADITVAAIQAPYGSALDSKVRSDTSVLAATVAAAVTDVLTGLQGARLKAALERASAATDVRAFWAEAAGLLSTPDMARDALSVVNGAWLNIVGTLSASGNRYVEQSNAALQHEAVAALFAARLAGLVIDATYVSFDDAQAAASAVFDEIHRVIEYASSPALMGAVALMLGATYQGLSVEALKLPRRVQFPIVGPMSTLEVSYRVYGTIDRADEIQQTNAIADASCIEADAVWVLK